MRSSRTVSTTTPSPRGRRLSSSTRTPTGSRRRSTTSRTANAGSRVARRPLSSRLPLLLLALVAACATAPPREPVGEAARALTLLADRASEFTDLRALAAAGPESDLRQAQTAHLALPRDGDCQAGRHTRQPVHHYALVPVRRVRGGEWRRYRGGATVRQPLRRLSGPRSAWGIGRGVVQR